MAAVLYHKSRDARDFENVHPVIDALWNLVDAQQEDVMDAERLKNMRVKMVVAPALDNDLIGFYPLYFDPFPTASLDEYRIPDRQKKPGDDMAIANYEPEKDKGRTRLLRKWDPLTRGDLLLESLITGIYHYTFFEDNLGNPYLNLGGGWLFGAPTEKADKKRWNSNLILLDGRGNYSHVTDVTCVDCVVDSPDTVLLAELSVILSIIRNRMRQESSNKNAVYPILMLSFVGPQHGQIIHSTFDRTTLTLQYSQLFSFKRKETAPLKLFFQYFLSIPIYV